MKNSLIKLLIAGVLLLYVVSCAKRSTPSGGDKDITPPKITSASPEQGTTNFNADKIRIYFDEYIKLKDLQKQLIVSPPLKNTPDIVPQGSASRYLEIKLRDTLKENTTYVFNFGQSVVDNNEGNPYSFFSYVFSTGDYIDSLTVNGYITDALQKKADQFVSVMLYEVDSTFTDSIIYKKPPTYITNTLDSANTFQLTNLKEGKYMMVAMKDVANNYVFNQKTDKIAFISDFIEVPSDSVYRLNLFKEITNYRATVPSLVSKNRILFGYEGDPKGMKIEMLSTPPDDFKYKILPDQKKDTLHYWFTPFEADSLLFKVSKAEKIDTFTVRIKDLYRDSLSINPVQRGTINFNDPFAIAASIPIDKFNKDLVSIINKDSLNVDFTSAIDTLKNTLNLKWDVQPNERYNIVLLPNALEDFYGNTNDTLSFNASSKSLADLGSVRVTLKNVKSYPIIVQLTDDKGEVKYEKIADEGISLFDFRNIDPAKYSMRVIYDTNGNKKWDTGNYLLREQPEKVSHFPGIIEIRSNWELEQEFILD